MQFYIRVNIIIFPLLLFVLFMSSPIQACTIPTYQYALERWPADHYEAFVFHRGALSPEDQAKVEQLQKASRDEKFSANIMVKTVDLAEPPSASLQKLWELPWMVIKYPRYSRIPGDMWSGKLEDADLESLLKSPARKKIASRILKGETAVWAFLESGNEGQDKAAFSLLEEQLKRMSETLKVEIPDINPEQSEKASQDVSFSALKLSRDDPRERLFIQMMLNTEPDLKTISKPMAFPIFARGRLLYAFVGDGISADNIEAVCSFLVAWCSCEVKELNPGVDLLMSVNWDNAIYSDLHDEIMLALTSEPPKAIVENSDKPKETAKAEVKETPKPKISEERTEPTIVTQEPAVKISDSPSDPKLSELNKEAVSVMPVSESTTDRADSSNLVRNILIMMSSLILCVTIVTFAVLWRKKRLLGS